MEEVEDNQKVKEVKVTEVETSPTRTLQFSTSVEVEHTAKMLVVS